jgi:UDP-N-acetylmuramoyl-L-alanyl-D-glutamate--2,6-diaminopimelate ligase
MRPQPIPVRLADLAAVLDLADDAAVIVTTVTGITLDSRAVLPGDLYAALPGHVTHGARFAPDAVRAGAVAILTDLVGAAMCGALPVPVLVVGQPRHVLGQVSAYVYSEPARGMQILGVTGTNGKTTVAAMVDSGLRAAGRTTGIIGTVGIQVAGESFVGARTTPEATELHAALGLMRERGVTSVVMEVSSIALEEHRVDGVVYDVAAFTNLSQDHLDYHGTMAEYFAVKAGLFTAERSRQGLVGTDDEWGRQLAARCTIPFATWSLLDPGADWRVVREGAGLVACGPGDERQPLTVPMPGAFNVANAVCAYGILRLAGVTAEHASQGISSVQVPGRMQVVSEVGAVRGIVDYAHSPDAIERVLRAAREDGDGRVIAVLGAGGDRDRGKRRLMGRTAASLADVIVITDDNPRSEDPASIRAAVLAGTHDVSPAGRAEVHEESDRATAITVAVGIARPGDVVLVLGKGHEQGQEAAGVVTAFDDATVLRAAMTAEPTP